MDRDSSFCSRPWYVLSPSLAHHDTTIPIFPCMVVRLGIADIQHLETSTWPLESLIVPLFCVLSGAEMVAGEGERMGWVGMYVEG